MKAFSLSFHALVGLVVIIVSLAITLSAANAEKSLAQKMDTPAAAIAPVTKGTAEKVNRPRCLALVSASYEAASGKRNKMNTIRAWRQKVTSAHGKDYQHWSISQKHVVNCAGTAKQQKCTASAHPCRIIRWNMDKPVKG